jgi:hypothetical protein
VWGYAAIVGSEQEFRKEEVISSQVVQGGLLAEAGFESVLGEKNCRRKRFQREGSVAEGTCRSGGWKGAGG